MNKPSHPLKTVGTRVLEEWGMMLVDECPPPTLPFDSTAPIYKSWVTMHGVVDGTIEIVAQERFLTVLADNLLGSDSEVQHSLDECKDAFKEMGNVLAGNFLTEAYGDDTVFDLLYPHVAQISDEELRAFTSRKIVYGFVADEAPVAISFAIKEHP